MKTLKRISLTALVVLVTSQVVLSQSFDSNRMSRDIRIMESILGEMFKTRVVSGNTSAAVTTSSSGYLFYGNSSSGHVKGTYVPGYGVIFMIPSSNEYLVVRSRKKSDTKVVFQYSANGNNSDRSIDEESITNRISEFLRDYASTIGQLSSDESILVIYGATSPNGRISVYNLREQLEEDQPEPLPVISVSAKRGDLNAYKSGQLSAEAFQDRLAVSKSEDKEYFDLKVLGNIFSTALGDGDGNQFHLVNSRSLTYLYLENFGALYSLNLHRGHALGRLSSNIFQLRREDDEDLDDVSVRLREEEQKFTQILEEEYDALISKTKEFIVDYGRTLSSVKSNQYLLVSLNISESNESIPERVDFQIKKSDLENLDKGSLSREQAMDKITVTEYN